MKCSHVTPKDGPSAGGAITLAIVSQLARVPVRHDVAMTGEIDLNGKIHQIGGLLVKYYRTFAQDCWSQDCWSQDCWSQDCWSQD